MGVVEDVSRGIVSMDGALAISNVDTSTPDGSLLDNEELVLCVQTHSSVCVLTVKMKDSSGNVTQRDTRWE